MRRKLSIILSIMMVLVVTSFTTELVSAATVTVSGSQSITIKGDTVKLTTTNGKAVTGYTLTKGGSTVESRSYSPTDHTEVTVSFASKAAGSYVLKYNAQKIDLIMRYVQGQGYVYRYVYSGAVSSYTVYITNEKSGGSSGGGSGSSSSCLYGHTYTNNCDTSCNKCGAIRTAPHSYSGSCDEYCNSCSKYRSTSYSHSYSNSCDQYCNVCNTSRSVSHSYTDNCDNYCGLCGAYRIAPHDYRWDCDSICDDCGYERYTYEDHSYDDDCDDTCSYCDSVRTAPHDYDYDCEEYCSDCGDKRVPEEEHYYSYACSKECYYCGATREAEHLYDNACDEDCNECYEYRSTEHNFSAERYDKATLSNDGFCWKVCSVCGEEDYYDSYLIYSVEKIKISKSAYTYDGKVKKPTVTVVDSMGNKLKKNKDYKVTYADGCKKVGSYKVKVTMMGKYSGSKTLKYKINPAKTTIKKVKPATKSLKITVNKKTTQISGYQIQYSTKKTFKNATTKTLKGTKSTSTTIKKLKAKKTYYVRVRTYKTVGSTKYYSDWSSYKVAKTK